MPVTTAVVAMEPEGQGDTVAVLRPDWPVLPRVGAAVSLRCGGVSAAPFASLNLAAHVGDDPAAVAQNRRRLCAQLALPAEPLWLSQVHGTCVMDADQVSADHSGSEPPPQADAAVTRQAGRVLAVLVADCLPVLFARRDGGAVALAHAGWRGLAAGVLEATVAALDCPGQELYAWLGPAIGPAHFEVGEEVRAAFCLHEARAAGAFERNRHGRWQCDLHQLARQRLAALGVQSVHGEGRCSYALTQSFYSYRRDGITGRMAALIWLHRD
jgi:hypothetical protein